jgi:hypothetical protein
MRRRINDGKQTALTSFYRGGLLRTLRRRVGRYTIFRMMISRYFIVTLLLSCALRGEDATGSAEPSGFQWKQALWQSGMFLGIQHGVRIATEDGTRSELKGPFFRDWFRSVGSIRGWDDGDPFLVNYVGHPMMGAVTGFIEVQNDPEYRRAEFGRNRQYWRSRMRALAFASAYSAQFELGPLSEASIGNVQMHPPETGVTDLVITPTVGLGWQVAEDALDRLVVRPLESRVEWTWVRVVLRGTLNPARSFANMLRFKPPWHRDDRPGVREP